MQAPKRLSAKFIASEANIEIDDFVPIFQRWIQEDAIDDELLIDVADYKHVHHGPGILLIGHEGDYGYTFTDGKSGLQYTIKQNPADTLTETITLVLSRTINAAQKLVQESRLQDLSFTTDGLQITLLDRLHYPNTEANAAQVTEALQPLIKHLYGENSRIDLQSGDVRDALRFAIQTDAPPTLEDLQQKLADAITQKQ